MIVILHVEGLPQRSLTVATSVVEPGGKREPPAVGSPTSGSYSIAISIPLISVAVNWPEAMVTPKKVFGTVETSLILGTHESSGPSKSVRIKQNESIL